MSRRAELALVLAIPLLVVAIRAPFFDLPLERDEGEYAYIAWRMQHGEVPYRDAFDQKPPGIFFAYRLALAAPGDPVVAIRALAALASAIASLALYALVRGLLGPGSVAAAAWSALLLAFLSADPMIQGPIANTELFMLPFLLAAAAWLPRVWTAPGEGFRDGVVVGVLLGLATAMKQVAIVNAPFFLLMVAWRLPGPRRGAQWLRFATALALGGLLAWAPLLGWLALRGALAPGLDAVVLHNLAYAGAPTLADRWGAFRYHVTPLLPTQAAAWLLAALGLALLSKHPRSRFAALFLAGFAAFNALGVSASGRYYPHYFQQLLPAVAALAGATAFADFGRATPWLRRALPVAALLPLLVGAIGFWRLDADAALARMYPDNPFEAMPAIAREIEALCPPDERVFVFGSEPELLFYARRASASRYIYLFPLFGNLPGVRLRWEELAGELTASPPALVAWMPNAMTSGGAGTRWLEGFLAERYVRHAVVVWDDTSRGRLVRVGDGAAAPAVPEGASVWATLWRRREPVRAP